MNKGMNNGLHSNEPTGPLENRWTKHRFDMALVNPANRKNIMSSWSVPGWRVARPLHLSVSWVIR